jgi:hypothetical protein
MLRTLGAGPVATVLRMVATVACAGLAACTYNFDRFVKGPDANVGPDGSSGAAVDTERAKDQGGGGTPFASGGNADVPWATGGAAGSTSATDGAADAPPASGGGAGGETVEPDGGGTGDVNGDGGGTGGMETNGMETGGGGTGDMGTGGVGGAGGGGTGGMGTGGVGGAGGGGTSPDPDLVLWYPFDESSGTNAADSAAFAGTASNATLTTMGTGGSATFSTQSQVGSHAVMLTPSAIFPATNGGYVTVPALQPLAPGAITIAIWVNLTANTNNQNGARIFNFGIGSTQNNSLYLVARAGSLVTTPVQFVIASKGHPGPSGQTITSPSALTPNAWHHIAIVLPVGATYTGTMYVDGTAVATNAAMTLHAEDLGATTNNFLGRSQFNGTPSGDPLFNGSLDDFRVYKRALSKQEISALYALR